MSQITMAVALGAGFVSFASPCVLPLVPGYLSFVAGVSVDELRGPAAAGGAAGESAGTGAVQAAIGRKVLFNTAAFVVGFSLVFIALGASATALGSFLLAKQRLLSWIAGAVVIVFGLHTLGLFRLPFLYREKRVQLAAKPAGLLGSLAVGLAFAFGWTPCIGPILAGVLSLAATEETLGAGIGLLGAYSLGLAIPFLLTALVFNRLLGFFQKMKRHMRLVEIASGLLLVGVGGLIMSDTLTLLSRWAQSVPILSRFAL